MEEGVLCALVVVMMFEVNTAVPIPKMGAGVVGKVISSGNLLSLCGVFAKKTFDRFALFTLNVNPTVATSVVVRLLAVNFRDLRRLRGSNRRNGGGVGGCAGCVTLMLTFVRTVTVALNVIGKTLVSGDTFFVVAIVLALMSTDVLLV